ncbi:MAG TPA: septum formation initiator family protein [Candidatus Dojkabacteria bacterium]|nr:septum formation initiator family protein [Candidatus Dojkabacteria bacterium]
MDNSGGKVRFKVVKKSQVGESFSNRKALVFIGNFLLVITTVFLIYNIFKSVDLTIKKIGILNQAEREVDDLRLKNVSLLLSREEVETDDYIETEARDRLNLARKDELVFVISDIALQQGFDIVDAVLKPDLQVDSRPVYTQWVEFFTR